MDLLARREHGRVELTRKLRQRGASDELIEPALDRLAEEGLLSEARYLESFIRYRPVLATAPRVFAKSWGSVACPRDIDQALRESEVDWAAQLQDVWQRKFAGQRPMTRAAVPSKPAFSLTVVFPWR
jgi:regulatory protein